jgi:4-amino-4-deoxy-L-arabinose transferase-like glycosyltransferase
VNQETLIRPAALAILFTFASVGIVFSSISILRGRTQGYLAGLVLLCTPYFIIHGANQYADIPVAFFYLSTIVLLTLQDEVWEKDKGLLILAGLVAGLTAWTKNEGILFIILVIAARFAVTFRKQAVKFYLRQLLFFAAGLVPILLIIFYFKVTVAAQNGYLAPLEESNLMSRILDISRYQTIGDYLIKKGLIFGNWAVAIIPLLAFYLLLLGARLDEKRKRNVIASLSILGLMFLGFLAIYVISSRDVDWLIVTSLDRLISQLWPSIIFIFFLTVKTPEEALMKEDVMSAPA